MFSNGSSLVKMHRNVNQVLDPEALPNTLSIFSTFYSLKYYIYIFPFYVSSALVKGFVKQIV